MAPVRTAVMWALLVATLAAAGCGEADPPTVGPLTVGPSPAASLQDDRIVQPAPAGTAQSAFADRRMAEMVDLGATVVRVDMRWDWVASARPADPADPDDPAYDWSRYDPIVAAARRYGVRVLFTVWSTPGWAVDSAVAVRPTDPGWGNRRPADAADYGRFAHAAAARYAPRGVHMWEAWNEPNIALFLRPQYERRDGRWVPVSPETYTRLLNAFRDGVRAVDPDAQVAGGVMAPVGDPCGLGCEDTVREPNRIGPQQFLLALDAEGLRPAMDAVSQHPYPPGAQPSRPPTRRLDMYNLADLPRAVDATYLAGMPLWVTEYGIQTQASDALPYAVTPAEQAAFVMRSFGVLRDTERVRFGTYYSLQDNGAFNTGLLDVDGGEKPGASAFALPVTATPARTRSGEPVAVVGQARAARGRTTVILERRTGDGWVELDRVPTLRDGTFARRVVPASDVTIRARWSGVTRTGASVSRVSPEVTIEVEGD